MLLSFLFFARGGREDININSSGIDRKKRIYNLDSSIIRIYKKSIKKKIRNNRLHIYDNNVDFIIFVVLFFVVV